MTRRWPGFLLLVFVLSACDINVNLPAVIPSALPTGTPRILSPTPVIIWPPITQTSTVTATGTASTGTPSLTPTPANTPSLTLTPTGTLSLTPSPTGMPAPQLVVDIVGCNTSLDILHGMGEVTNAYALIKNPGSVDLTNVCATLSASDEARVHPNKTQCAASLPAGYQVTLKLTVDTGTMKDTSIRIVVVTNQGVTASIEKASCQDIGFPIFSPGDVGTVEPIP